MSAVAILAAILVTAPPGVAAPVARATDDSCSPEQVPEDGFSDVAESNTHEASVDCVVWWALATGTSPTTYAPGRGVTREQMATFVLRLVVALGFEAPEEAPDAFPDDEGSVHEDNINRLAAVSVVGGRNSKYFPAEPVTRDQMATFLVRAFDLVAEDLPTGEDAFPDDDGNAHEPNIDKAAAAGFTGGRADGAYNPGGVVLRDQMASFLARVLDLGVEQDLAEPPGGGEPGEDALVDAEAGGAVTSVDGKLRLDIPPGALAQDTVITIEEVPEDELPEGAADDPNLLWPVYDLGPDGVSFAAPVTVTRTIHADELKEGDVARAPRDHGLFGLPPTPLHNLVFGNDSGEGEWPIDPNLHWSPQHQRFETTATTYSFDHSRVHVFNARTLLDIQPAAVEVFVGDTWTADVRVTPSDGATTHFGRARGGGVVETVPPDGSAAEWQCMAPGETLFEAIYGVRAQGTSERLGDYFVFTPSEEPPTTVSLYGHATCKELTGPEIALRNAVVCANHGGYGAYPSSMDWVLDFEIAKDISNAIGRLQVTGMNNDQVLEFPVPPAPASGASRATPRGGISSYGEKEIQSFTVEGDGTAYDLTEVLKDAVGAAPNVGPANGPIGGSGECP